MSWWAVAIGVIGDFALVWAGWKFWFKPQIQKIAREAVREEIQSRKDEARP